MIDFLPLSSTVVHLYAQIRSEVIQRPSCSELVPQGKATEAGQSASQAKTNRGEGGNKKKEKHNLRSCRRDVG